MVRLIRVEKRVYLRWMVVLFQLHLGCCIDFVGDEPLTTDQYKIKEFVDVQAKITDRLLKNYDKRFIPALPGKPLKVDLRVEISDVLSLGDNEMEAQMILYIRQEWTDYRLSWKSSEKTLNSSRRIKIRAHMVDKIWRPDIRINNLKDMNSFEGFGGVNMNVYANGRIYYSQLALVNIHCPMNLRKFPMDEQTCFLNFSSYAYGKDLIAFSLTKMQVNPIHLPHFEFLEAKEIVDYRQKTLAVHRVSIALKFQRRSGYYILQIYIPSTFLVVLSWVAFLMDSADVASRLAIETTMVVSIVFLHGELNTSLPPVSYAKASDWFVIVSFAFILLALLETMLVHHLATRKDSPPSSYGLLELFSTLVSKPTKKMTENNQDHEDTGSLFTSNDDQNMKVKIESVNERFSSLRMAVTVDRMSMIVFPSLYLGFHIFYWSLYE